MHHRGVARCGLLVPVLLLTACGPTDGQAQGVPVGYRATALTIP